jgi:hypothetical protein
LPITPILIYDYIQARYGLEKGFKGGAIAMFGVFAKAIDFGKFGNILVYFMGWGGHV